MSKMVLKFLLGRGVGKVQEVLSKGVRHAFTTYGGALVGQGLITSDDMGTLQGAGVILVGVALSLARTFLAKYAAKLA